MSTSPRANVTKPGTGSRSSKPRASDSGTALGGEAVDSFLGSGEGIDVGPSLVRGEGNDSFLVRSVLDDKGEAIVTKRNGTGAVLTIF